LQKRGLKVVLEVPLPVVYEGHKLELGYRIDLLVEDQVVVEVKAVDCLAPIHRAQLLSYLRLSGRSLGLLFNFNVVLMKNGIVRMRDGC
jgi:GxxExxY protein